MRAGKWGTRFGFYLAAIGSAFGLGNLWRFPYVVAENGGGAFVLLYVFLAFIVGMPFLIGELILGRLTNRSVVTAVEEMHYQNRLYSPPQWLRWLQPVVGKLSLLVCFFVLSYFVVVSGWVLHFFMQFLVAQLVGTGNPQMAINVLRDNGWLQILLMSVHLLIVAIIVARDVEEGIEKWVGFMMPAFGLLLIVLVVKSLSLKTANEAMRFLFYPDFSKLRISSFGQALGHIFFTLSVGFGTMVTFGSYLRDKAFIPISGFRVTVVDTLISLFAGLLIFPLVFGSARGIVGPELLFHTVPSLLSRMPGGYWFGIGFFLCLYLAALGASIGLLETIVANLRERYTMNRQRGTIWAAVLVFLVGLLPALSSSLLSEVRFLGRGVLELIDWGMINWLLPLVALLISQLVLYGVDQKKLLSQFTDAFGVTEKKIFTHWLFVLRWLAVPIVLFGLISQFVDLIKGAWL